MFENVEGIAHDKKHKLALIVQREKPANNPRMKKHINTGIMICFHDEYQIGDQHDFKNKKQFLKTLVQTHGDTERIQSQATHNKLRHVQLVEQTPTELTLEFYQDPFQHEQGGIWHKKRFSKNTEKNKITNQIIKHMTMCELIDNTPNQKHIVIQQLFLHENTLMLTTKQRNEKLEKHVGWLYAGTHSNNSKEQIEKELNEYNQYLQNKKRTYTVYDNGVKTEYGNITGTEFSIKKEIKSKLREGYKHLADELTTNTKLLEDVMISMPLKNLIDTLNDNNNDGIKTALSILTTTHS